MPFFPWHDNYLPPNIPSACSSMCSKSKAPEKKSKKKRVFNRWRLGGLLALRKRPLCVQPTGHVVGSFNCSADGQLTLGVALVKFPLENGKQAGNPVVQTHIQDELMEEDRTEQRCDEQTIHEAPVWRPRWKLHAESVRKKLSQSISVLNETKHILNKVCLHILYTVRLMPYMT